jgi:O-antigen/teichoic acid export membrane protein
MLNKLKNTLKHTFIYGLGNLSIKLIGLVLLPLYTKHLSSAEYGAFAILEVTSLIITYVFSFKLSTSMMRWWSTIKDDNYKKVIVFTAFSSSILVIIFLNINSFIFSKFLSDILLDDKYLYDLVRIVFLSASFEILNYYALELIRLKEKSILYVIIAILRTVVVLTLNIILVAYCNYGIKGILLSQLSGHVLVLLITFPFLRKNMILRYDWDELKKMLNYCIPLVFSTIAMMLMNMGDRYLIRYLLDFSDVGIYSLGYKISSVINIFVLQSFQMGFLPIAYKQFQTKDANRFFSKTLTYYTLILTIAALVISLFGKELIELLSKREEYFSAYKVIPFFSLAFILRGVEYVFSLGLHYTKKTKYNAIIVFSLALLNILLNFIFIPVFKIIGAAVTTVICWILMAVLFYNFSQKFYKVNYEIKKIIMIIFTGCGLFLLSFLYFDLTLHIKLLIKILSVISFPFILFLMKFYEPIEIIRLKEAYKKWRNPLKWKQNILKMKMFSKK